MKNSKKDPKIIDKIAANKLNKFIAENTLLNQEWIIEPKKKVSDVIKEVADISMVVGNPGKQISWVDKRGLKLNLPLIGNEKVFLKEFNETYILKNNKCWCE